jgi:hypothetical protein
MAHDDKAVGIPCVTQNFPIFDSSIRGNHVCQFCRHILSDCITDNSGKTIRDAYNDCIEKGKPHVCGFCSKELYCYTKKTKDNKLVLFTTSFSDTEQDQVKHKEMKEYEKRMAEETALEAAKKAKDDAEYEEFKRNQNRQTDNLLLRDGTLRGGKKIIKKSSKKNSKKSSKKHSKKSSKKHSKKSSKKNFKKHQKKH